MSKKNNKNKEFIEIFNSILKNSSNNSKSNIVVTNIDSLIKKGFNLDMQDKDGKTPLMIAVEKNNIEIVKLLYNKGCNLDIQDKKGDTALIFSLRYRNHSILKFLVDKGSNLNIREKDGETALIICASIFNTITFAKIFIEKGNCDLNIQDNNGITALSHAVVNNNSNLTKLLIENHADLNIQDNTGKTALIHAVVTYNFDLTKLLIENRADLNIQDNTGKTALSHAVNSNNFNLTKLLIENHADLNIQDNTGKTALIYAVYVKNFYITKLLIEAGADLNIEDKYGKTALIIAKEIKIKAIIDLFIINFFDLNYDKLLTITDFDNLISNMKYPDNFPRMIHSIYKFIKSIPIDVNNKKKNNINNIKSIPIDVNNKKNNINKFIKSIPIDVTNKKNNINKFYAKAMYNFLIEEEYNKILKNSSYTNYIRQRTISVNNGSELKKLISLLENNTINYNTPLSIIYITQRGINAGGLSRQFFNNLEEQLNYYYKKKRFEESRIKLLEKIKNFKSNKKNNSRAKRELIHEVKKIIEERSNIINEKINENQEINISIINENYIKSIPNNENEYNKEISLEILIKILALSSYNKNPILYNEIFDGNKYEIIINSIIKEFNINNYLKKLIVNFYLENPSKITNKEININSLKIMEDNFNSSNINFMTKFNLSNNNNIINSSNNKDKEFIDLIKKYYNKSPYTFYVLHMIDFKINKDKLIKNLTINFYNFNNNNNIKKDFVDKINKMIENFSDEEIEKFNFAISGSKKMCPKYIINITKTNDSNKIVYHTCFYTMDIYISNIENKNSVINSLKANILINSKNFNSV